MTADDMTGPQGVWRAMEDGAQVLNEFGKWVPAIPLPYYFGFTRVGCVCGLKFWSARRYREHYALVHVMGLE